MILVIFLYLKNNVPHVLPKVIEVEHLIVLVMLVSMIKERLFVYLVLLPVLIVKLKEFVQVVFLKQTEKITHHFVVVMMNILKMIMEIVSNVIIGVLVVFL